MGDQLLIFLPFVGIVPWVELAMMPQKLVLFEPHKQWLTHLTRRPGCKGLCIINFTLLMIINAQLCKIEMNLAYFRLSNKILTCALSLKGKVINLFRKVV